MGGRRVLGGSQRERGLTELDATSLLFLLERFGLSKRPVPESEPVAHLCKRGDK